MIEQIRSIGGDPMLVISQQKVQQSLDQSSQKKEKYALCECRNNHIIGLVIDNRFYLTDISQVELMFP